MTTMQIDRAVVEQALEVINDTAYGAPVFRQEVRDTITALRAALAHQAEPDAYGYASRVAVSIWQWNYKDTAPNWKPLDDLMGVLTQIDNMTSGLTRRAQQAEPVGTRALIEECLAAFAEELAAWDIDPPLHHLKQAHDKCEAWLAALAQQAEPLNLRDPAVQKRLASQWGYVPAAAQAEPVEPVVRECSDPMCACRGGPCAECEEGEREKEIEDLRSSLYFYQRRCEALQSWQSKMRDPERTIVCDILANGKTLDPAFAGDRYTAPPQQAEPEPVAWSFEARHIDTAWGLAVSLKHPGQEHKYLRNVKPLYTAPPQRKPLTEGEIEACRQQGYAHAGFSAPFDFGKAARAVERAHGIKE